MISRREFLKRIGKLALGIGVVSFFAKGVFADQILRGKDGVDTLEYLYYNETTGLLTLGKEGDTQIGTGTKTVLKPNTDLMVDLGNSSNRFDDAHIAGKWITGTQTELTISGGVVAATKTYHSIDTESGAASDDLDTINGGSEGMILIIRANDSARTVVAKDGVDNLQLAGDFTMDNVEDTLFLIYNGADWLEISRSNNGA